MNGSAGTAGARRRNALVRAAAMNIDLPRLRGFFASVPFMATMALTARNQST